MSNLTTRLLLVVVSTVFYLGLAVLARGGIAAFFSQPALIALSVVLVVLAVVALFAGGNLSSGIREDRGNRWVIAVFTIIALLDAFLPAWSDRKGIWTIDEDAIRWLGVMLFAAGGGCAGAGAAAAGGGSGSPAASTGAIVSDKPTSTPVITVSTRWA